MRANMDPLNPMASTLDPAIAQIYTQASSIREAMREAVPEPGSDEAKAAEAAARRARTKQLAKEVLATPERLRQLAAEGRTDEARREWETPRKLLLVWRRNGVGGEDVESCLEAGDAVFRSLEEDSSQRTSKES